MAITVECILFLTKEVDALILQAPDYTHIAENIAKVFIPAITAAIAIFNWRAARFRSKLKDDFDILERYREEFDDETDPSKEICKHLRARIQRRMYKAYVLRNTDKSDIVSGLVFLSFAAVPWILFSTWPFILRVGLAVLAASFGLAFLYTGIRDRNEPRKVKGLPAQSDE